MSSTSGVTLRTRLVLITTTLAATALAVAGCATYVGLRGFLLDRFDREMVEAYRSISDDIDRPAGDWRLQPFDIPAGTYVEIRDAEGDRLLTSWQYRLTDSEEAPPEPPTLPADLDLGTDPQRWFTQGDFRVLAVADTANDRSLVIAMPLDDVETTLKKLVAVELVVSGLAIVGIVVVGSFAVRVGLRPLRRIQRTAEDIAAGDLSQRVGATDDSTEVGQLARAFDVMVNRLEGALEQRAASEDRLRRFVSDASHELRTPLTSIRGYSELYRRGMAKDPDDLDLAMRRIEEEALRMGGLVDDLLLLARLDEGRPLDRGPVELGGLAADAVADLRVADPARPVSLDVSEPVVVLGDEARLRQVLGNLLGNAREHTPAGTAVALRVGAADGRARIVVADRGPGLPPDQAAHIFERFYRVDGSRARTSGGSGLGLSIVAAIVRAHAGTVQVDTAPGRGATFIVTLPLAPPEAEAGGADTVAVVADDAVPGPPAPPVVASR